MWKRGEAGRSRHIEHGNDPVDDGRRTRAVMTRTPCGMRYTTRHFPVSTNCSTGGSSFFRPVNQVPATYCLTPLTG